MGFNILSNYIVDSYNTFVENKNYETMHKLQNVNHKIELVLEKMILFFENEVHSSNQKSQLARTISYGLIDLYKKKIKSLQEEKRQIVMKSNDLLLQNLNDRIDLDQLIILEKIKLIELWSKTCWIENESNPLLRSQIQEQNLRCIQLIQERDKLQNFKK